MFRSLLALVLCLAALPVLCLPARADDAPAFYADQGNHCSVGTYYPGPQISVHWEGSCAGGKAEGSGVAEWEVAGKFSSRSEGVFRAGLLEGRGLKMTADGRRYEAEFRNGKMNGRCVVNSAELHIDTQCVDDKYNGGGVATFANGSHYDGEFHDGHLSGRGVFYRQPGTSGSRMEGNFTDGVLNGPGRYVFPDVNESYEGNVVDDEYDGTGTYRFSNGSFYEGEWSHGLPNGRGVWHATAGGPFGQPHDYAGTWVNGCFHQGEYHAWLMAATRQSCGFD